MAGYDSLTAHTRFAVPRIPNAKVRRPALLTRLDTARDCVLTLVTAAPGSGKSALLAEWATQLRRDAAWLSCDIDDADPSWFWRDVRAAIEHAWPCAAVTVTDDVAEGDPRQLAIQIANALVDVGRGVIVIDDFHVAAPGPAAMIAFIDALPATVRLVLGSRHDPPFSLSRMRIQGRLLELRQDDLKFTSDETRELLADLGVELSPADVDRVLALTEGWPVGVHLAGLSLRTAVDPEKVLSRLVDTDRSLIDFLMSEVIELQSDDMQEFLAVTGQLETFDAALCDAVTGRGRQCRSTRAGQCRELVPRRSRSRGSVVPLSPPLQRVPAGADARHISWAGFGDPSFGGRHIRRARGSPECGSSPPTRRRHRRRVRASRQTHGGDHHPHRQGARWGRGTRLVGRVRHGTARERSEPGARMRDRARRGAIARRRGALARDGRTPSSTTRSNERVPP